MIRRREAFKISIERIPNFPGSAILLMTRLAKKRMTM
jgi:hypothetical protein